MNNLIFRVKIGITEEESKTLMSLNLYNIWIVKRDYLENKIIIGSNNIWGIGDNMIIIKKIVNSNLEDRYPTWQISVKLLKPINWVKI